MTEFVKWVYRGQKEFIKILYVFILLGFGLFPLLDHVLKEGEQTFTFIEVLMSSFIIVWSNNEAKRRLREVDS